MEHEDLKIFIILAFIVMFSLIMYCVYQAGVSIAQSEIERTRLEKRIKKVEEMLEEYK